MKKAFNLFLLLNLILASCSHQETKHEEILELSVTNPKLMDTKITQEYVCQIHAIRNIELRALEKGYLQAIYVDEGQRVSKGTPMFKILPSVYEADLNKAQAEAEIAKIEYENTKALAEKNVVSTNELALAKAKLDKANAEVSLASAHLGFTNISAPFTGIMDHLRAREGSLLDEGELLTTLSDNSEMWVYFNVPEAVYLDYISKKIEERPSEVSLEMANGKLFNQKGYISAIEGEFNNETGNIQFRASFLNPDKILRHGQTGKILIDIPYENALVIPQKASFEILDKVYVFVLTEENKIEQRHILIAEELPNIFIVKEGLKESDKILIDGLRKVSNGDEIIAKYIDPNKVLSELELYAE
ncbi:MAG: efflux RND transporter periplasmic adaptor subunit [Bacteroidetes bacterium]|nr:efflux RND transporter periplasmic adaptor subunit [Bacteroidota bacterium]